MWYDKKKHNDLQIYTNVETRPYRVLLLVRVPPQGTNRLALGRLLTLEILSMDFSFIWSSFIKSVTFEAMWSANISSAKYNIRWIIYSKSRFPPDSLTPFR